MRKTTVLLLITFGSFLLVVVNIRNLYVTDVGLPNPLRVFSNVQKPGNTIPRRIHQIWNDDIVPAEFAENVRGFVKNNPHPLWEYYYWTKESGLKLLADKYPYLHHRVMSGASDTMRADILRYAVIYEYGGLYFDMDTVSVKPLDDFVDAHACAVALEPGEHYFSHRTDFLLTNAALFCRPRHSFYKHLMLRIATVPVNCNAAFRCTGPPVITRLYRELNWTRGEYGDLPDVQPSEIFQDVYDTRAQARRLADNCQNDTNHEALQPYQKQICANWKRRGMDYRALSDRALTFHTWFHVYGRKMILKDENNITNLVPHVKLYGRTF